MFTRKQFEWGEGYSLSGSLVCNLSTRITLNIKNGLVQPLQIFYI